MPPAISITARHFSTRRRKGTETGDRRCLFASRVSRLASRGSLSLLQLGEACQQPLNALAGEGHGDLLIVLDQLRADDNAIAEGAVAHFLAGEECGLTQPSRATGIRPRARRDYAAGARPNSRRRWPARRTAEATRTAAPRKHRGLLAAAVGALGRRLDHFLGNIGQEARRLRDVGAAVGGAPEGVQQVQPLLRARRADIKQPPLLLQRVAVI